MKSQASAVWKGGIKDGDGEISTESGVLSNSSYSFGTRFEGKKGLNPEELIAAAHAACFSMALSKELGDAGNKPDSISTTAEVTLNTDNNDISITGIHLTVNAKVPGIDRQQFEKLANGAKDNCPVSKVLNADITMDAQLQA